MSVAWYYFLSHPFFSESKLRFFIYQILEIHSVSIISYKHKDISFLSFLQHSTKHFSEYDFPTLNLPFILPITLTQHHL